MRPPTSCVLSGIVSYRSVNRITWSSISGFSTSSLRCAENSSEEIQPATSDPKRLDKKETLPEPDFFEKLDPTPSSSSPQSIRIPKSFPSSSRPFPSRSGDQRRGPRIDDNRGGQRPPRASGPRQPNNQNARSDRNRNEEAGSRRSDRPVRPDRPDRSERSGRDQRNQTRSISVADQRKSIMEEAIESEKGMWDTKFANLFGDASMIVTDHKKELRRLQSRISSSVRRDDIPETRSNQNPSPPVSSLISAKSSPSVRANLMAKSILTSNPTISRKKLEPGFKVLDQFLR